MVRFQTGQHDVVIQYSAKISPSRAQCMKAMSSPSLVYILNHASIVQDSQPKSHNSRIQTCKAPDIACHCRTWCMTSQGIPWVKHNSQFSYTPSSHFNIGLHERYCTRKHTHPQTQGCLNSTSHGKTPPPWKLPAYRQCGDISSWRCLGLSFLDQLAMITPQWKHLTASSCPMQ